MKKEGTKRIGIHCDNYKSRKYKRALASAGYPYKETKLAKETFLYIDVAEHLFEKSKQEINKIATKLELGFKRSN